jgi:hypothetical protein
VRCKGIPGDSAIEKQSSLENDIVGSLLEILNVPTNFGILPAMDRNTKGSSCRKTRYKRGYSRQEKRVRLHCMALYVSSQCYGPSSNWFEDRLLTRILYNRARCFELLEWNLAKIGEQENVPVLVTHFDRSNRWVLSSGNTRGRK